MPLTLLITSLILAQEPVTAPGQTVPSTALVAPNFQVAPLVAEPTRLAISPKLDGVIEDEEWDEFSGEATAKDYFQWEPGKLHFAATVAEGTDLLVSVDLKADGWLVGSDNLEIRVSQKSGTPTVTGRLLDMTNVAGPRWIDVPGISLASQVVVKSGEAGTTFEVSVADGGKGILPKDGRKVGVRIDTIASDATPGEPFVPRILAPVTLAMKRAAALPANLRWDFEGTGASVTPGEGIKIRFKFNGTDKVGLQRLAMRTKGLARMATSDASVPFPSFDNKGRAFVDYTTPVAKDAEPGYRVAQGTLTTADGVPGVVETSYRIAPLLELSLAGNDLQSKPMAQTVRLTYTVKSNSLSTRRIDGNVKIMLPPGFRMIDGDDRDFGIFSARSSVRRVFQVEVPSGAAGVYPIGFRVKSGDKTFEETGYLNLDK